VPSILIRNLSPETVESFKASAKKRGRSLQAEIAAFLEDEAERRRRVVEFAKWADDFRRRVGPQMSDSADLIREDRDTDHGRDYDSSLDELAPSGARDAQHSDPQPFLRDHRVVEGDREA
jgi:hypothetical protein